jgi:ATP-dependent RNA helicase SUPV3L1/SUV3
VRFGAYNIYFPLLLKPAAADLLLMLWALKHGTAAGLNLADLPEPPRQGLTSVPVDVTYPPAFYRAVGFQICGPRAVRIDMLERLADLIRPLSSWKPTEANPEPPAGAVGRGGFKVQPEMMSIMGCSAEELGHVLFSLGFRKERRPIQAKPAAESATALAPAADEGPVSGGELVVAASEGDGATSVPAPAEPLQAHDGESAPVASEEVVAQNVEAGSAAEVAGEESAAPVAETVEVAPSSAADAEQTQPVAEIAEEAATLATVGIDGEGASPVPAADIVAAAEGMEAAAGTPEEQQFEEIWRPRRRGQGDERPAQRRRDRPGHQGQAAQHHRDRGPRQGHGERTPAVAAAGDQPGQQQQPNQHPRGEQRHDRRRDGERRDDRRRDDRPREGRPPQEGRGREDHRRRDDRKGGGGRPHSNAPRVQSASPRPQKDRAANADSPFAALMQLKEQLERRTQDQA